MDYFNDVFTNFLILEHVSCITVYAVSESTWISSKISYRFGMTWGWVINRGGRKKSIHLSRFFLKRFKNRLVYLRIDLDLIILLFLSGGGEKLALFNSNRGRNVSVCSTWSSTTQTISVWHQSTARAIRKHAERLFSVALAVLWCHTTIGLCAQYRCIRWRRIHFKPARESKTMTEAEDQTSSRILSSKDVTHCFC